VQIYQLLKTAFQARLLYASNITARSADFKKLVRKRSIHTFGLKARTVRC
jgi:hypothetical protein